MKDRATLAACVVVLVLGVGTAAAAVLQPTSAAGTVAAQQSWAATLTCIADTSGYCTLAHPAGVVPDAVQVTPERAGMVAVDQKTATTFRVRFYRAVGSGGSVTVQTGTRVVDVVVYWTPSVAPSPSSSASASPSPTPSPSGTPVGWPGDPGVPVGIPVGTVLIPYSGPCTVTVPNTVIDGKVVGCDLDIRTTGVLIKNSRVSGEINGGEDTGSSFTVQDSQVVNTARTACQCVGSDNFVMRRVEVVGGNRGVYCRRNCDVQDSWIHGQQLLTTQHASALREEQGSLVRHNKLSCDWPNPDDATSTGCSADLTGYPDFAPINHNTVDHNLLVAQQTPGAAQVVGFCAYGGATGGKPFSGDPANATNQVFTNNVFQRGTSGRCGDFGPITDFDTTRTGNVWSGNVWDDGTAVPPA